MKQKIYILIFVFGVFSLPDVLSQEKESAEISLEEYSDAFQENFFEALRESGIENYDKAINFLLECKKLDPENEVVDFELGKNYLKLSQYYKAEDYILKAVEAQPENIWYLEMLLEVYRIQNNTEKSIEVANRLAAKNIRYKENLVMLYAKVKDFDKALSLLDELDKELGTSELRKRQRFRFSILKQNQVNTTTSVQKSPANTIQIKNPFEELKKQIETLIAAGAYAKLLKVTDDAIESYPSQASFYYANGLANNKTGKYQKAISSLESALDFLIDDLNLENSIYKELAFAYRALGNVKKANEYLGKERKGS